MYIWVRYGRRNLSWRRAGGGKEINFGLVQYNLNL